MVERRHDQAAGLRRMFAEDRVRVIHVVAGCARAGRMSVAVNLSLALAKAGHDTLLMDVIDEGSQVRALGHLGLEPRTAPKPGGIVSTIAPGPHGLAILPVALEARRSPARVAEISRYCGSLDFALITGASPLAAELLPLERSRREVIVVLSSAATSITGAYALIKRMSAAGMCQRFHILVNRTRSDAEAVLIFRNMAQVARGFLDVELNFIGAIAADPVIEEAAALGRGLLDGWPNAPAASAFRKLARAITRLPQTHMEQVLQEHGLAASSLSDFALRQAAIGKTAALLES